LFDELLGELKLWYFGFDEIGGANAKVAFLRAKALKCLAQITFEI
jgi:hypothetical protein